MTATSPSPNIAVAEGFSPSLMENVFPKSSSIKVVIFLLRFCPGSVFCVSLDPATNSMAVTGGEDDKAFVWRVSDGEVLLECTGEGQSPQHNTSVHTGFQIHPVAPLIRAKAL